MDKRDFCHLHLHTEMSLLDGIIRIPQLCDYLKAQGMSACAITDHGAMGGIIEFYKACKKTEIKPLIGIEAYITNDIDGLENKDKTKDNMHCVMIAQNEEGLANIIWLSNMGYLNNFYYKPRMSMHNLKGRTDGIICLSACMGSFLCRSGIYNEEKDLFVDHEGKCEEYVNLFSSLFKDRFYLELQDLPVPKQQAYNKWLIEKSKEKSLPLVITSDAHFLTPDDFETHKLIMAKNTGRTLEEYKEDEDGLVYHREHHVRTADDVYESACRLGAEEAFYNTMKIADQCSLEIKLGEYKYPQFDITQEDDYDDFLIWKKEKYNN